MAPFPDVEGTFRCRTDWLPVSKPDTATPFSEAILKAADNELRTRECVDLERIAPKMEVVLKAADGHQEM